MPDRSRSRHSARVCLSKSPPDHNRIIPPAQIAIYRSDAQHSGPANANTAACVELLICILANSVRKWALDLRKSHCRASAQSAAAVQCQSIGVTATEHQSAAAVQCHHIGVTATEHQSAAAVQCQPIGVTATEHLQLQYSVSPSASRRQSSLIHRYAQLSLVSALLICRGPHMFSPATSR